MHLAGKFELRVAALVGVPGLVDKRDEDVAGLDVLNVLCNTWDVQSVLASLLSGCGLKFRGFGFLVRV
jgi:hypothetical protein